ncbi:hypothetical protein NMY22_g18473 [Coprinellus aureogranulatus]|nr:hypothetical protein NMY22_g18473 [Coprinellus aureogranulatus]
MAKCILRLEMGSREHVLFELWAPFLARMKLPDKRRRRSPHSTLLDHSKLKYDMPADLNFQVFDNATGGTGLPDVHDAATTKKSIRLEDRGVIVQIGFSAGSRDAPEFGWVRNTLSKKTDEDAAKRKVSSFMTAFWLMSKQAFPSEIVEDFENFHRKFNVPRFHPEWPDCDDASRGPLELPPSCGGQQWDDVDLAPGSAVMVQRYARAVHLEHQPHDWALNWTTLREGTNPQGGNFVLAKYGILIRLSPNSAFAWKPKHFHATTLANFKPQNDNPHRDHPTFDQHSVAFVTSPRVGTVYQEWEDANIPRILRSFIALFDPRASPRDQQERF